MSWGTFKQSSLATFDAYAGVEMELPEGSGCTVTLPALRFADGVRFMRLSERSHAGDTEAAETILRELPEAVGLDAGALEPEEVLRIFARCFDPGQYAPQGPSTEEASAPPDEAPPPDTFDDLLADYVHCYGSVPRPDSPWPLFLALAARTQRFDGRMRLQLLDSVAGAIAASLGDSAELQRARDELVRLAYPSTPEAPPHFLPNRFAKPEPSEDP